MDGTAQSDLFCNCDSCGAPIIVGDHLMCVSASEQIAESATETLLTERCSQYFYCLDCAGGYDYSRMRIRAAREGA